MKLHEISGNFHQNILIHEVLKVIENVHIKEELFNDFKDPEEVDKFLAASFDTKKVTYNNFMSHFLDDSKNGGIQENIQDKLIYISKANKKDKGEFQFIRA
jgi:hypothetical protein